MVNNEFIVDLEFNEKDLISFAKYLFNTNRDWWLKNSQFNKQKDWKGAINSWKRSNKVDIESK